MSDEVTAFYANLFISGHPITVSSGSLCTQRGNSVPVEFAFNWSGKGFSITAGELEGRQYVGWDQRGFLRIQDRPEVFFLKDSKNQWVSRSYHLLHVAQFGMFASDGAAVIHFEHDRPEDVTQIYNYLIAARKIKRENIYREDNVYLVPAGNGGWVEYPADKLYSVSPAQIVLNVT